ncbi:MAG: homocysteine S-methyltransferase family protein [Actinomycetales bacterium]|nr:homocysteine S-methyltransferase family protein [Actinomycetales bacterium]
MGTLLELLRSSDVVVGDGAMGTMLQTSGLDDGGAPELWNVDHPDRVGAILEAYAAAGSQLLTTNTFGGTRPRLLMHDLQDRVHELNRAGAQVARAVADRHPGVFVLGDVGPSGDLMEPMGTLTMDSAVELFAEQIAGLVEGGVDAILIETMSDLMEVEAAVRAAQEAAPGLPIIATMSFDTNLRTMMGVKPAAAVSTLGALGVLAVGANCGRGTDEMRIIAAEMVQARADGGQSDLLLITQSNAGLPRLRGDEFVYDGTPEELAAFAVEMRAAGVDIIGACCGSTPEHIRAIRTALA